MNSSPVSLASFLVTLLELRRRGIPATEARLGSWLGLTLSRVLRGLALLEAQGLVDAASCRLTLAGLATAASLEAQRPLAATPAAA